MYSYYKYYKSIKSRFELAIQVIYLNLKMEKINLFLMVSVACNKWLRIHYPHKINCK